MKKQLNKEQRKFLEYLKDNHKYIGWAPCIKQALEYGKYDKRKMDKVVLHFKHMRNSGYKQDVYGKFFKYLK